MSSECPVHNRPPASNGTHVHRCAHGEGGYIVEIHSGDSVIVESWSRTRRLLGYQTAPEELAWAREDQWNAAELVLRTIHSALT